MTLAATRRLPPWLAEHARAYLIGDRVPVEPRHASTVVLLRPSGGISGSGGSGGAGGSGLGSSGRGEQRGVEVYLLRRHRGMEFAAGMFAFPGGTVDPRDADRVTAWAGPSPAGWAARLACEESMARALVCAAVRETFEESGVLLAGSTPEAVVGDTTGDDWERDRAALVDRSLSFVEFLDRRDLVLRTDLLAPWAQWITPEFEPRRYDTRFFLAVIPPGQRTRDVSGEADTVAWMPPDLATAGVDDGAMAMLPPTYVTLRELAGFATPEAALAAAGERRIVTVCPGVEFVGGEALLTVPPDVVP